MRCWWLQTISRDAAAPLPAPAALCLPEALRSSLCCSDSCAESPRTGPVTCDSAAQRSALRFRAADPGETPIGSLVAHGEVVCTTASPFCPPRLLGKSRLLLMAGAGEAPANSIDVSFIRSKVSGNN